MGIFKQIAASVALVASLTTAAQAIDLSAGQRPACSGQWNQDGSTYRCQNGSITVTDSTVTADQPFLLFADANITVNNSTIEGSLRAQNGFIQIDGSSISGNAVAGGNVQVNDSAVAGTVRSDNNSVQISGSSVSGNVEAPNGPITIDDGQIAGNLIGQNNDISVDNTSVNGGVSTANGNISITNNSAVFGDIETQNGSLEIDGSSAGYATCTPDNPRCGGTPPTQCEGVWPRDQTPDYSSPGQPTTNPFTIPSGPGVQTSLPAPSNQNVVNLQPTDYVIDSSDFADNTLPFARYQTNGTTSRVFVNGDLRLDYRQQGNRALYLNFTDNDEDSPGPAENLMLIVIGTLEIDRRVRISGYVYATEGINFTGQSGGGNEVIIGGSITSSGPINLDKAQVIQNYIPPPPGFDSGSFCEEVVNPPITQKTELDLRLNDGPWSSADGAVKDSSDNQFNATAINGVRSALANPALPTDASGFGTCAYGVFDSAQQQYMEVPHQPELSFVSEFTVGVWVRPQTFPNTGLMTVLSKNENYEFHIKPDGRINWWWQTGNGNTRQFDSDQTIAVGEWSYIAIRYTPAEQTIFVNGEKTVRNLSGGLRQNTLPVQIGSDQNFPGRYFNGAMDNITIARGALSDAEVEELSERRVPCDDVQLQCVVDDFDDGSALTNRWQVRPTQDTDGVLRPRIVDGQLRLTENIANQSTLVSLRRVFPAANNRVEIEFDLNAYGGTGADGIAIVLSNADFVPVPGGYGGSLGYAQRTGIDGFNGGWLGVGLDTFGNFVRPTEGRVGGLNVGTNQGRNRVTLRGAEQTDYRFIATTNQLTPGLRQNTSTRGPGHRYRIIIDSTTPDSSFITVERDIKNGSGFQTLIDELDIYNELPDQQPVVPENFRLSFTGSTGGSNDIHELDNLRVCAQRSFPLGDEIDHLRLTLPTELVSCYAADLLVEACLDDNCDARLSGQSSARIQASDANAEWGGADLIGSDGQGNADIDLTNGSGRVQLSLVEGGVVDFSKLSSTPATLSSDDFRCYNGTTRVNCTTEFNTAGLAFFDSDEQSPIQNQIAGTSFPATLRALQTNTMTGACEARVEGSQTVELGYECRNPGSCIAGQRYEFNGTPVANGGNTVVSETVTLNFDASGTAPLDNLYTDAGEIRLHAQLDLPAEPRGDVTDPAVTLSGVSNPFVVKPERLVIDAPNNTDVNQNGNGFVAAGDAFELRIRALNGQGDATPNFGNENMPVDVNARFNSVTYPDGGFGGDNELNTGGFIKPDSQQGRFITDTASWLEAGIITLRAELVDGDYLGAGDIPLTPASDSIGRFYPKEFVLQNSQVIDACNGGFTYLGEDAIEVSYELNAVNTNGTITRNYDADGYAGTAEIAIASDSNDIADSRVEAPTAQSWEQGILSVFEDSVLVARAMNGSEPRGEGPYPNTGLALRIEDALDPTLFVNDDREPLDGDLNLRFGRLLLADIAGPEDEDLRIEAQLEYWDGNRFIVNEADNCFYMRSGNITDVQGLDGFQPPETGPDNTDLIMLSDGRTGFNSLYFESPGTPGELQFSYVAPSWLLYDWDESGDFGQQPSAFATFGQYRGNDRIIFWLEQNLQ
ncbi:DUF6701 domain-containing protein [Aliidiomarina sp. Khilg15.8]